MPYNYFAEVRKGLLRELINILQQNDGMDIKQIVGIFALKTGMRSKTIISMLEQLKDAGKINIEGEHIIWKG